MTDYYLTPREAAKQIREGPPPPTEPGHPNAFADRLTPEMRSELLELLDGPADERARWIAVLEEKQRTDATMEPAELAALYQGEEGTS